MYVTKSYYPHIAYLIPIAFIIGGIVVVLKKKRGIDIKIPTVMAWIFIIVGVVVAFLAASEYILLYKNVYLEYRNGNYIECEGKVENLYLSSQNGVDTFEVNGKKFEIGNEVCPGYQKKADRGGIVNEEGIWIKIKYCEYTSINYIMEIHIQK